MDEAKITVLYDDGALEGTTYIGGKGFSMLIEVDGEKTLFGAGRRVRYLSNNLYLAEVDTDTVARVVVSHGHPDHWAGLPAVFAERESDLEVYAPVTAWGAKKFIGATGIFVPAEFQDKLVHKDVTDWVQFSNHLFVSPPMKFHDGEGEEVFMILKSKDGPVLISGCCHCGLDHIFEVVRDKFGSYPIAVLGGLHLEGKKDNLSDIYAKYLQDIGCRTLYLNHCTGIRGIGRMRVTLGLKGVNDFYAGQSVTFQVF